MEEESDKNEFKKKIIKILTDNGFLDKRSSKMPIEDFLKLLYIMNTNDVHFR